MTEYNISVSSIDLAILARAVANYEVTDCGNDHLHETQLLRVLLEDYIQELALAGEPMKMAVWMDELDQCVICDVEAA